MRIVIWTFLVFSCCVLLLLPTLDFGWQLPADYALVPVYSLIGLSFILQWEALAYIKMTGSLAKIQLENKEHNQSKLSLDKLKKKNADFLKAQGRLETKLAALEGKNESLEEDLSSKNLALRNEKARLFDLEKKVKDLGQKKDNEEHVITLLSLLQENGRFLDFLMDDITSYNDEQVGAASRIVHQGCVKVLKDYFDINPIFTEEEGTEVKLTAKKKKGIEFRLVGDLSETEISAGKLLHKGWKTNLVNLPKNISELGVEQKNIISPAEIEMI